LKGGLGSASRQLRSGITVGVIAAVNAFGEVWSTDGRVLAGSATSNTVPDIESLTSRRAPVGEQTTLALVATDADLDRPALLRVAQMAHDGLARAIRPSHTGFDGDCVFALATARRPAVLPSIVGAVAAELLALAIERAILEARSVAGVPTAREWAAS
jgi:L-aminopeptidase/D-esterase-like protein